MREKYLVSGAGLGLRRDSVDELLTKLPEQIGFMEVAPENWIGVGGKFAKQLHQFTEKYDFMMHGLSLNLGGFAALDETFIKQVKKFMEQHNIMGYSEHLSYCADEGHMYDLMPIPFTEEAIFYVADRIKRVQDIIEQRMIIENVSYYAAPGQEMSEIEFLTAVIEEADCDLLIDINNIYVNSVNHNYDASEFLKLLPGHRIAYSHIAGHYNEAEDLIVDTHGSNVADEVWHLLDLAYSQFGVFPTLLERDFNIPPVDTLLVEVERIIKLQSQYHHAPTYAYA